MARKQTQQADRPRRDWSTPLRYAFLSTVLLGFTVLAIYAYNRVDSFLATDPRFRLAGPSETGGESPNLRIEGILHASRKLVLRTLAPDFGRSVYLAPIAERRRLLLAIDWVKDASISRQWPDRLVVRIEERTPVAFVELPLAGEDRSRGMALIDEEGVILEPPARARFSLPVLSGIRREQPAPARRARVRQALRLLREVGKLAGDISEIDVSDPENVKVSQPVEGRAVLLLLGNDNFLLRLQNFLAHYPEIHKRLPEAAAFDLRLDDRITAVEEDRRGG